jgi:hypothetical protein
MLKHKTKWFDKWSKKNLLSDKKLLDTLRNISNNLGVVNLGGALYKIRVNKEGQGKSGGFRTIVVYRQSEIAIFVYGFSKNVKSNLNKEELTDLKILSKDLLSINKQEYQNLVAQGEFINIKDGL